MSLRVAVERVEDLNSRGKRSIALQVSHGNSSVGVRISPSVGGNLGSYRGAVKLAGSASLK